jgi:hypothetical protein
MTRSQALNDIQARGEEGYIGRSAAFEPRFSSSCRLLDAKPTAIGYILRETASPEKTVKQRRNGVAGKSTISDLAIGD